MSQIGKDIADELKEVSPESSLLGDRAALSLPEEGYFEEFPSALMSRIRNEEVTEELEAIAPLLATAPRKTAPFSTPYRYFDGLDRHLIAGSANEPVTKVITMGKKIRLFKRCLAAAVIAGVIVVSAIWGAKQWSGATLDRKLAQISDQEIVDFLQYRSDDFDDENIFANVSLEENMPSVLPEELSNEQIDNMLEENILRQVQLNN